VGGVRCNSETIRGELLGNGSVGATEVDREEGGDCEVDRGGSTHPLEGAIVDWDWSSLGTKVEEGESLRGEPVGGCAMDSVLVAIGRMDGATPSTTGYLW